MRAFWAALGTIALASSAMAADLPVKAPAPLPAAPIPTWTGFYIGGHVGALWGNSGRAGRGRPRMYSSSASFRMSAVSKEARVVLDSPGVYTAGTIGNSRPRGLQA